MKESKQTDAIQYVDELLPVPKYHKALMWISTLMMFVLLYLIFIYSSIEKVMGPVQKIFYFHVGAAWTAFLSFIVVAICGAAYLITRKRIYDIYAGASAELGVMLISFALLSGMFWARSSWNTWWEWEPRLTTTLILWFIFVAYLVVRHMDAPWDKKARMSAVIGIIGALDVPVVFMAIRWWNAKLHPVVLGKGGGGMEGNMLFTMIFSFITFSCIYLVLLQKGVYIEKARIAVQQAKEHLQEKILG